MANLLTISGSPHDYTDQSTKKIMWGVVIALVPAMLVSFWYFGLGALYITLASVLACVLFEYLIQKYLLIKETKGHMSVINLLYLLLIRT